MHFHALECAVWCVCVGMYACMQVCVCVCVRVSTRPCAGEYVHMCLSFSLSLSLYIYIYIYIQTHTMHTRDSLVVYNIRVCVCACVCLSVCEDVCFSSRVETCARHFFAYLEDALVHVTGLYHKQSIFVGLTKKKRCLSHATRAEALQMLSSKS